MSPLSVQCMCREPWGGSYQALGHLQSWDQELTYELLPSSPAEPGSSTSRAGCELRAKGSLEPRNDTVSSWGLGLQEAPLQSNGLGGACAGLDPHMWVLRAETVLGSSEKPCLRCSGLAGNRFDPGSRTCRQCHLW